MAKVLLLVLDVLMFIVLVQGSASHKQGPHSPLHFDCTLFSLWRVCTAACRCEGTRARATAAADHAPWTVMCRLRVWS